MCDRVLSKYSKDRRKMFLLRISREDLSGLDRLSAFAVLAEWGL